ncbi:hypothetical protein K8R03_04365 [Candidatus Kaiserbacteria bacterium]|nr:hypothetical protein [Candidatus Kaiserbacteria bacterium]
MFQTTKHAPGDTFFIIFLVTIAVSRIFLLVHPIHSPILGDFHMHHYMYGLILLALGLSSRSLPILAMGAGLFADEIPILHNINAKSFGDYFAFTSMVEVLAVIVIVFWLRHYLVMPLQRRYRRGR